MNIVVLNREKIENIPPLISVIELLLEQRHSVTVITTDITEHNRKDFIEKGAKVKVIPYEIKASKISKIQSILLYRKELINYLSGLDFDLLWVEGGWTIKTCYGIYNKYPYILQISELYDYKGAESVRKIIGKVIRDAITVVMPELNRATLYKVQYSLNRRPFVLPNKPYFYLEDNDLKRCLEKYKNELKIFREKKVILYQGIIAKERDLTNYIQAVKELGDEYIIVLLGPDHGMLQHYKEINPDIVHIDYIPAPDYLVFTSEAYIGILTYDASTLNCAYCAPNKLYEYGRYGLPMLGNDIPGLIYTIEKYNAGVIVDEFSKESIKDGILKISNKYDSYSANSKKLYVETDNYSVLNDIISYSQSNLKK